MEQLATFALWQDKQGVKDISELLEPKPTMAPDDPSLQHIAPELRAAFTSGSAPVHDRARLPRSSTTCTTATRAATTSWWTTS